MTQAQFHFEDFFTVESIDKDVNRSARFERVSRVQLSSTTQQISLLLDVNIELFPVTKDALLKICFSTTLHRDGQTSLPKDERFDPSLLTHADNIMRDYEYALAGVMYHINEVTLTRPAPLPPLHGSFFCKCCLCRPSL